MDIFYQIAERKIAEAMQRGEFDKLPLKGQKLELRETPYVPPELQMSYRVLRNAGIIPEELALGNEIDPCANSWHAAPGLRNNRRLPVSYGAGFYN